MEKPKVGISSCLLGEQVRYDGEDKRNTIVIEVLSEQLDWLPVCPEVEAGMSVPREPVRLTKSRSEPRMIAEESGRDWTSEMVSFCAEKIEELASIGLHGFVLKSRSPSCGLSVPLLDEGGDVTGDTTGLFAGQLARRFPQLPIIEESHLEDSDRRERWLRKVMEAAS